LEGREVRRKAAGERPGLDVIEEALALLRSAPAQLWLAELAGTIPFALGLVYFWSDMSGGAFARRHIGSASLVMGAGFIWLKIWQSVFAAGLLRVAEGTAAMPWTGRRIGKLIATQVAAQPSALFLRPIAALVLLPYAWVHAFYANLTAVGDGSAEDPVREAIRQAKLWPRQNHLLLTVLWGFAVVVWINIAVAFQMVPSLLKALFGVETPFSMSPWSLLNSSFLAATCAATFVCVDPLFKAAFVTRCYHGRSIRSGSDLRNRFRRLRPSVAVAAAMALFFGAPGAVSAAEAAAPAAAEAVALDRRIDETLQRPEFAWRLPREAVPREKRTWLGRMATDFFDGMGKLVQPVGEWIEKLVDWIRRLFPERPAPVDAGGTVKRWIGMIELLLYGLLAITCATVGVLLWRQWRLRRRDQMPVAEPVAAEPDLESLDLTADQLPHDEWFRLGEEKLRQGEWRLALRAFHLSALSHLGRREWIRVAKFKSDRDYEMELRRRARDVAGLLDRFRENRAEFEKVWYGLHEAGRERVLHFRVNVERMLAC
jgi:hypothetical protein